MKITCDLCGGALQINLGGQGATCTNCGLSYTMDRLREKLTGETPVRSEPPKPVDKIYDVPVRESVEPQKSSFDYEPEQFVMENNGSGNGDLCGRVQQGGIGRGDFVYIDGDYDHPYKVYIINDDPYMTCAKAGMPAELYLVKCPRKVWKNARMVTGDPNPVANAYNYPGTVKEYFSHLLLGTFGEYEIRGDVPKNGLDIPVNYLFCQGGKPVLAVFLLHSNDSKGRSQVRKAVRIFALEGVDCTHFYENYRNDAPYVIDRVQGALPEARGIGGELRQPQPHDFPVIEPESEPIILEVVSANKRPGMAWGNAKCIVRQGVVACGMPYYARINTLEGEEIHVGSLNPGDVGAGSEVKMLLYCDKALLPTIKVLYVFPAEEYDDGMDED